MDWTIVVGAAGAVLGSALTLGGVWLTARQREKTNLRDAWLRQLAMALSELASGADSERRFTGRAILESLVADDSVSIAYRALADKLLERGRGPSEGGSDRDLDGPNPAGDNEEDAGGANR